MQAPSAGSAAAILADLGFQCELHCEGCFVHFHPDFFKTETSVAWSRCENRVVPKTVSQARQRA